jgi:hypothetical protein
MRSLVGILYVEVFMYYKNLSLETIDGEIWKDMIDFEGMYKVSNLGRIKSLARYRKGKVKYYLKEKILKQTLYGIGKGYLYTNLANSKTYYVHRNVALAFITNPQNKLEVNHIDGNTKNNKVDNLSWCTKLENMQHAYETGLISSKNGESNSNSKLKEQDVIEIRTFPKIYTNAFICKLYGVGNQTVSYVRSRRSWKHI